jgi:hypothetical protein
LVIQAETLTPSRAADARILSRILRSIVIASFGDGGAASKVSYCDNDTARKKGADERTVAEQY